MIDQTEGESKQKDLYHMLSAEDKFLVDRLNKPKLTEEELQRIKAMAEQVTNQLQQDPKEDQVARGLCLSYFYQDVLSDEAKKRLSDVIKTSEETISLSNDLRNSLTSIDQSLKGYLQDDQDTGDLNVTTSPLPSVLASTMLNIKCHLAAKQYQPMIGEKGIIETFQDPKTGMWGVWASKSGNPPKAALDISLN